ncbi:hypothetical protein DSO57_1005533 [Entomophthora muscae]|uniref:Uncharacterized protein n=1 Tax=Entomophthora muscae TaxID=34485 RepID=A0ACC2TJ47_9FUNG|nr:hypothetical protein DSO57_1005533 [Entomophthora muscae]
MQGGEMSLLNDNGQKVEDRAISYSMKQSLEQRDSALAWQQSGAFATYLIAINQLWACPGSFLPRVPVTVHMFGGLQAGLMLAKGLVENDDY